MTEGYFGRDVTFCFSTEYQSKGTWYMVLFDESWGVFSNNMNTTTQTEPRHCLTVNKFPKNKYRTIRFEYGPCYVDIHVAKCLRGRN